MTDPPDPTRAETQRMLAEALPVTKEMWVGSLTSWEAIADAILATPAGRRLTTTDDPAMRAPNWLDSILLDYVNLPFGQSQAIECRDRIRAALAATDAEGGQR